MKVLERYAYKVILHTLFTSILLSMTPTPSAGLVMHVFVLVLGEALDDGVIKGPSVGRAGD